MSAWAAYQVLVAEDSRIQREYVCNQLQSLGFTKILEAEDGIQALKVFDANPGIDFLITDLDMPGMDGIELIRHVIERDLAKYVIVMTARDPKLLEAVENMAQETSDFPLLGTLRKPVELISLNQLLQEAFKEESPARTSHRHDLKHFEVDEIAKALQNGEIIPYYQPKVLLATGITKGAEALARWLHPEAGLVSPAHFIPQIEATPELVEPFTMSILRQVLTQITAWQKYGLQLTIAVNLPAYALADNTLADRIAEMMMEFRLPPHLLVLEVTETMVMNNLSVALGNLARLRLKGFGLAMDDYGVGYSSIQQLSRCPFTELKIDRAFVHGAAEHDSRRVILESSIEMGKRLNITTVAEGVEKLDDWRLLQLLGCDVAQGYYAGKPMPANEFPQWIRLNRDRLHEKPA